MFDDLWAIDPLTWTGIASTLACGGIIGLERQILGKPVGIRTSMLICLSTYIFVTVSNSVAASGTDPSRIIGQVVTGVGFLGGGVMLARDGIVVGVTSAAAIWILAAIGVTVACNHGVTGIKLAVLGAVILVGVTKVEHTFKALQRGVHSKFRSIRRPDSNGDSDA